MEYQMITINYKNTLNFLKEYELDYLHDFAKYSNELLENKKEWETIF